MAVGGSAIEQAMAPWKQILLKSIGVGLGMGIGLSVAAGFYVWYSSRPVPPKPWDSAAITANFRSADTAGENNHFRFRYILENHTERDYRAKTSGLFLSAVLREKNTLTGSGKGDVKFAQDTIFLPAKDHAEVVIELPTYSFTGQKQPKDTDSAEEHKRYRDAVKKYVDDNLPGLSGFAAFDETNKYRINFPNGWHNP
jgi:hypothetical protein